MPGDVSAALNSTAWRVSAAAASAPASLASSANTMAPPSPAKLILFPVSGCSPLSQGATCSNTLSRQAGSPVMRARRSVCSHAAPGM